MKHNEYTTEFVQIMPKQLEEGVLYLAPHFGVAMHKCMCGCGEKVCTQLGRDGWTWKYSYDGKDVSLNPSVGNFAYPCRSHYFLKNGKVQWC